MTSTQCLKGQYGDQCLMLQYHWNIMSFYIYNTFQTKYICVQSGTQQAYVLALDGGIEKDDLKKYFVFDCLETLI